MITYVVVVVVPERVDWISLHIVSATKKRGSKADHNQPIHTPFANILNIAFIEWEGSRAQKQTIREGFAGRFR
ncbi:hypothetical protein HanRHA438_Chr16g0749831 [Helianthus annuus]|nr:hypothetical protein HanRHA438_Chr16g0749831 [Helianthus annuus]